MPQFINAVKIQYYRFVRMLQQADIPLLSFLLLFMQVKLVLKVAGIILICCVRPVLHFGWRSRRLPWFYPAVMLIAAFNYLLFAGYRNSKETVLFGAGIFSWLLCLIAVHQVKISVERSAKTSIYRSLDFFFWLNNLVSCCQLLLIIWEIGRVNPFLYQGMHQKYFMGTGDYIRGISFDTSTTNAFISALGVLYFLQRGKYPATLACMAVLLLTGSNTANAIMILVLGYAFFFVYKKQARSMAIVCLCMMVVFLVKVSPQNNEYSVKMIERLLGKTAGNEHTTEGANNNGLTADEQKKSFAIKALQLQAQSIVQNRSDNHRPLLPADSIHTAAFQHVPDSSAARMRVLQLQQSLEAAKASPAPGAVPPKLPGKLLAVKQAMQYLQAHPQQYLSGAGMGHFSSKLAFRATGLGMAGSYPNQFILISPAFADNHLRVFMDYFGKDSGYHSVMNSPANTYLQILTEYGLTGLVALFVGYLYFFARKGKGRREYQPVLLLLCLLFATDYWFEQLSVVVLSELILYIYLSEPIIQPPLETRTAND